MYDGSLENYSRGEFSAKETVGIGPAVGENHGKSCILSFPWTVPYSIHYNPSTLSKWVVFVIHGKPLSRRIHRSRYRTTGISIDGETRENIGIRPLDQLNDIGSSKWGPLCYDSSPDASHLSPQFSNSSGGFWEL